jgi:hypothetical protein
LAVLDERGGCAWDLRPASRGAARPTPSPAACSRAAMGERPARSARRARVHESLTGRASQSRRSPSAGARPMRGVHADALGELLDDEVATALEMLAIAREPEARVGRLDPKLLDELLGVGA